jgi:hypothetical protein
MTRHHDNWHGQLTVLAHSLSSVIPSVSGIQISSSTRSDADVRESDGLPRHSARAAPDDLHRAVFQTIVRVCRLHRQPPGSGSCSYLPVDSQFADLARAPLAGLIVTLAPPTDRWKTAILPLCSSTIFLTMASPSPVPPGFCGDIGLEYTPQQCLWKAGPVIAHAELHTLIRRLRSHDDTRYGNVRHRLLCVLQKIVDDLSQLRRVSGNRWQILTQVPVALPGARTHTIPGLRVSAG